MGQRVQRKRGRARQTRTTILLVTNGRRTEKEYLEAIKRRVDRKAGLAITVKVESGKEPETILRNLKAQRSDTREFDEIWIIVDHDGKDRSGFLKGCQKAKQPQIRGIVSTPCFEVWLTAHYEQVHRYQNQADAQQHYQKVTGLHGQNAKGLPRAFPYDCTADAERQCVPHGASVPDVNTQGASPSTSMPHLLRRLGLLA